MLSFATRPRLTLGFAAAASAATTASGAIVVFDIPDTTYDSYANRGLLNFSAINLLSVTYQPNATGGNPRFRVEVSYNYFEFLGSGVAATSWFRSAGNIVDAGLTFVNGLAPYATDVPKGTLYLGLRLTNGTDRNYGWFEFVSSDGQFNGQEVFTFTRFAFNDAVGQPIFAGQTSAVPEASTLGLVGGFFGLVAAAHVRRRKAKQAAASDKFLALAAGEKLN